MASPEYVRTFLSSDILVGERRGDFHGIRHIKSPLPPLQKQNIVRMPRRYLSDEPSTYLK